MKVTSEYATPPVKSVSLDFGKDYAITFSDCGSEKNIKVDIRADSKNYEEILNTVEANDLVKSLIDLINRCTFRSVD